MAPLLHSGIRIKSSPSATPPSTLLHRNDEHWTSLPAVKHTLLFEIQFTKINSVSMTFQGGFSARKGDLFAKNINGEWETYGQQLSFEDNSSIQVLSIMEDTSFSAANQPKESQSIENQEPSSSSSPFTLLKLEMTECADIHGRVTIYSIQVDGEAY